MVSSPSRSVNGIAPGGSYSRDVRASSTARPLSIVSSSTARIFVRAVPGHVGSRPLYRLAHLAVKAHGRVEGVDEIRPNHGQVVAHASDYNRVVLAQETL